MTRRSVLGMLTSIPILAADTDDPKGWSKVHWGMTRDDIRVQLPEAKDFMDEEKVERFGLRKYSISGSDYTVEFLQTGYVLTLQPGHKVSGVRIEPYREAPIASDVVQRIRAQQAQHDLSSLLIGKYGSPTQENTGSESISRWLFPTTEIKLSYDENDYGTFTKLVYSQRTQSDQV